MVYALIYTLFLGFGLQFGSDLFLLFDPSARHELDVLAARAAAAITITGTYVADPDTFVPQKLARSGAFTFTPSCDLTVVYQRMDVVSCLQCSQMLQSITARPRSTYQKLTILYEALNVHCQTPKRLLSGQGWQPQAFIGLE